MDPQHDDDHRQQRRDEHRVQPESESGERAEQHGDVAPRSRRVDQERRNDEGGDAHQHPGRVGRVGGDRHEQQRTRRHPAQERGDQSGASVGDPCARHGEDDAGECPRQRREQLEGHDVGADDRRDRCVEIGLERQGVVGPSQHDGELSAEDLETLNAGVRLVGRQDPHRRSQYEPPYDESDDQCSEHRHDDRRSGEAPERTNPPNVVGRVDPRLRFAGRPGREHDDFQPGATRRRNTFGCRVSIGEQRDPVTRALRGFVCGVVQRLFPPTTATVSEPRERHRSTLGEAITIVDRRQPVVGSTRAPGELVLPLRAKCVT